MTVYTDGVHLMAPTIEELHEFAQELLGFQEEWFQGHRRHPHYDLTTQRAFQRAIEAGAQLVGKQGDSQRKRSKELLRIMKGERDGYSLDLG